MSLEKVNVRENLLNVLMEITENENLDPSKNFAEQNVVSLDMLELGWEIESLYNISLETEELKEIKTLNDLVELVITK
jgi:acyl carrier protein